MINTTSHSRDESSGLDLARPILDLRSGAARHSTDRQAGSASPNSDLGVDVARVAARSAAHGGLRLGRRFSWTARRKTVLWERGLRAGSEAPPAVARNHAGDPITI